jgi:hypothetical protein
LCILVSKSIQILERQYLLITVTLWLYILAQYSLAFHCRRTLTRWHALGVCRASRVVLVVLLSLSLDIFRILSLSYLTIERCGGCSRGTTQPSVLVNYCLCILRIKSGVSVSCCPASQEWFHPQEETPSWRSRCPESFLVYPPLTLPWEHKRGTYRQFLEADNGRGD